MNEVSPERTGLDGTAIPWALAVTAVLLVCTLGQGGDQPTVMLIVHAGVTAMLFAILALGDRAGLARRAPAAGPVAAFVAFLAVALIGAATAPYTYTALTLLIELAVFAAVACVASRLGPGLLPFLSIPLLAAAAVHGTHVVVLRLVRDQFRPAGTFFNPNHLAAWLVAALFVGLGSWRRSRGWKTLLVRGMIAAPAVAALWLVGSRGAFLGLAAGASWLVAGAWPRMTRPQRLTTLAVAVVVLFGGVLALAERGRSPDPFRFQRIEIWRSSLQLLRDRPWFGVGPNQFAAASATVQFPDGEGPLRFDRTFSSTHSDYVRAATEFGVVGTLFLLAVLGTSVAEIRRRRSAGRLGRETTGAIAALIALLTQAAVENLSHRPAVYLLAAALLGALLSAAPRLAVTPGRPWRYAAGLVLLAVLGIGEIAPYRSWRAVRAVPGDRPATDSDRAALETAVRLNPLQPFTRMRSAEATAMERAGVPLDSYARAREAAETAVRLHPREASLVRRLARLEAAACTGLFRDQASRARTADRYREAQALSPFDPFIPLEAGEFQYRTSDFRAALEEAERAATIEPNAVAPLLLKARAALQLAEPGALEAAATWLREAEDRASRFRDASREDAYTRELLHLDPAQADWIGKRILEAGGLEGAGHSTVQ